MAERFQAARKKVSTAFRLRVSVAVVANGDRNTNPKPAAARNSSLSLGDARVWKAGVRGRRVRNELMETNWDLSAV